MNPNFFNFFFLNNSTYSSLTHKYVLPLSVIKWFLYKSVLFSILNYLLQWLPFKQNLFEPTLKASPGEEFLEVWRSPCKQCFTDSFGSSWLSILFTLLNGAIVTYFKHSFLALLACLLGFHCHCTVNYWTILFYKGKGRSK